MGLLKDYRAHVAGYRRRHAVLELFKPKTWRYLSKQRRQRADRGFADRDTWDFSEYLTDIIIEYLEGGHYYGAPDKKHPLGLDGSQSGSDYLFETIQSNRDNWKIGNTFGYSSIDEVIADLKNYRDAMRSSWTDHSNVELRIDLYNEDAGISDYLNKEDRWTDKTTGEPLSKEQISARMMKWSSDLKKLKKKSDKARDFFFANDFLWWD